MSTNQQRPRRLATRLLGRLRTTDAREIRFRCGEGARVAAEALRFASGRARWRREGLQAQLLPASPELEMARDALARRDWPSANRALASHLRRRPSRFLIAPTGRAALAHAAHLLFPTAADDAVGRADKVRSGRYELLGYRGLSFRRDGTPVDWHVDPVHGGRAPRSFWARVAYLDPRIGDHKIIWELNRHQHWLTLGRAAWLTDDARYAQAIEAELTGWMSSNPPLAGINWASMLEISFRSISWIWTLHLLAAFDGERESTSLVDLVVGLDRQLQHVAGHLSRYFSPNTHLLGEGLALYVAGRVLPELRHAAEWERIGRQVLITESRAQVQADGGHAERSAHYHRYTLDFYLLALAIARRTGDPVADDFAAVSSRLASFCRALADDSGRLPTIGDDDGGSLLPMCGRPPSDASDSLWLAAALLARPELAVAGPPEEALWMLGPQAIPSRAASLSVPPGSALYPETGFAVLRSPGVHGILDAGPHGFLNGGHAHAGALSLVLSIEGRPMLIDPGTATYTMDSGRRDLFRSTAMHNTVVIDGRPQSVPAGPFHWSARADARVVRWRPGVRGAALPQADGSVAIAETDYVEAEHDGYLPLVHRRAVLRTLHGLWIVADHVLGEGVHDVDGYWHFAPAWLPESSGRAGYTLAHPDGLWMSLDSTGKQQEAFRGDAGGLGWCAPVYGQLVASPTLRVSERSTAPLSLITAISAGPAPIRLAVEPARVGVEAADGWHRAAATVLYGDAHLFVLFATPAAGDDSSVARRARQTLTLPHGEYVTDARVAVLALAADAEPVPLALIDCSTVAWNGRGTTRTTGPDGVIRHETAAAPGHAGTRSRSA